jgi:hypothetical protein
VKFFSRLFRQLRVLENNLYNEKNNHHHAGVPYSI